ncbi:hypothetical protein P7K49_000084 [Saguinus oedipus]|uniref:Uncharacterized protein n=1 Tax=Saguinus oedipus TaxID=9490 RepID=A0ABQ9WAP5_SAGOE|nr:hypothetical protein P7K49_000084 [Saguinus oedipus]
MIQAAQPQLIQGAYRKAELKAHCPSSSSRARSSISLERVGSSLRWTLRQCVPLGPQPAELCPGRCLTGTPHSAPVVAVAEDKTPPGKHLRGSRLQLPATAILSTCSHVQGAQPCGRHSQKRGQHPPMAHSAAKSERLQGAVEDGEGRIGRELAPPCADGKIN